MMEINSTVETSYKTKKDIVGVPSKIRPETIRVESKAGLKEWLDKISGDDSLFLKKYLDLETDNTFFIATNTHSHIREVTAGEFNNIVNPSKINSNRWVNKFFEAVNEKLSIGGVYIGCVELYTNRKRRILAKYPYPFNRIYYFLDVILKRVIPKLPGLIKFYFMITLGKNRALSKAETFGRLYSCGFDVIDEKFINNNLFFVARKKGNPSFDLNPTYGPVIRLKRYGKGGRVFRAYKLRTMYPYSEYLQDYVYKHNFLKEGGKFKDDFRITTEGKFFRKFWLDEIPMLWNLLKGDMKIVGVRPLSNHYFNLYTEELKQKRIKFKPGLIPPYYADLPKTLDEIMASEMHYLEAYEKKPFRTDLSYFFKTMYNILIRGARSN